MKDENSVIRKGDTVIKTFASHLHYLHERDMYLKLKGTGLAAELLYDGNDVLEHRYAEGESLEQRLQTLQGDAAGQQRLFALFFDWYAAFRAKTASILGKPDLSKFILTQSGLVCVDLEHCKAGYPEADMAELAAQLALRQEAFSDDSLALCRLFVRTAAKQKAIDCRRFEQAIASALYEQSCRKGLQPDEYRTRLILSSAVCSGAVFAKDGDGFPSSALAQLLPLADTRIVCSGKAVFGTEAENAARLLPLRFFETGPSDPMGILTAYRLLKDTDSPWSLWLASESPCSRACIEALLTCDTDGFDGAVFTDEEGSVMRYPVLLRTRSAAVLFGDAITKGTGSVEQALRILELQKLPLPRKRR